MILLITLSILTVLLWIITGILYGVLHPNLLGLALLAWVFGLRHAYDADHICAIDNVTRKLLDVGIHSRQVGFYFSLGHSTIVVVFSFIVVASLSVINVKDMQYYGGFIGTAVSALFLLLISVFNFYACYKIKHQRNNEQQEEETRSGLLSKAFSPLLRMIDRPWKMYPIGVLFGLGFDTAAEIIVLIVGANELLPVNQKWQTCLFPLLFSIGMILMDTLNGTALLHVYTYKGCNPRQRLVFNFCITLFSALMSLFISILQFISFSIQIANVDLPASDVLQDNFWYIGISISSSAILAWLATWLIFKKNNRNEISIDNQYDE